MYVTKFSWCAIVVLLCTVHAVSSRIPNYYELLGIPMYATPAEIKKVYRELSRKYHPDTTAVPLEEAKDKMVLLNDARTTLLDPVKREEYHDLLRRVDRIGLIGYLDGGFPEIVLICFACPEYLAWKGFSLVPSHLLCTVFIMAHILVAFFCYVLCEFLRWREPAVIPWAKLESVCTILLRLGIFFIVSLWFCYVTMYLDTMWVSFLLFTLGCVAGYKRTPRKVRARIGTFLSSMLYHPAELVVEDRSGECTTYYMRASLLKQYTRREPTEFVGKAKHKRSRGVVSTAPKPHERKPSEVADLRPAGYDPHPVEQQAPFGDSNTIQQPMQGKIIGNTGLDETTREAEPNVKDTNLVEAKMGSKLVHWTAEDQRVFESALRKHPTGTAQRWEKVSEWMATASKGGVSKTPKQCCERFRLLSTMKQNTKPVNLI